MHFYAKGTWVQGMRKAMRTPKTIYAKQIDERFAVMRNNGVISGEPGDYLVRDAQGNYDIIQRTIFETFYKFTE